VSRGTGPRKVSNVFQKAATINHAAGFSKKCPQCQLRNFADTNQCRRCKSDLSLPLNGANNDKPTRDDSGEVGRSTFSLAWILAAVVAVLLGVVLLYMRQGPQVTPGAISEAGVAQPATAEPKQPGQDPAEQNSGSEAVAIHVLAELKRFQDATESGMGYNEYDEKLTHLKAELNKALPAFVRHEPGDETFRQEIAAAVRDYTAAGNWWKTTITNSSVFSDADRNERTQVNWASARTHLTTAEKMLVP